MTVPPKPPAALGREFEYHRRMARYSRARQAAGGQGSVTTIGFIPARAKPAPARAAEALPVWLPTG